MRTFKTCSLSITILISLISSHFFGLWPSCVIVSMLVLYWHAYVFRDRMPTPPPEGIVPSDRISTNEMMKRLLSPHEEP